MPAERQVLALYSCTDASWMNHGGKRDLALRWKTSAARRSGAAHGPPACRAISAYSTCTAITPWRCIGRTRCWQVSAARRSKQTRFVSQAYKHVHLASAEGGCAASGHPQRGGACGAGAARPAAGRAGQGSHRATGFHQHRARKQVRRSGLRDFKISPGAFSKLVDSIGTTPAGFLSAAAPAKQLVDGNACIVALATSWATGCRQMCHRRLRRAKQVSIGVVALTISEVSCNPAAWPPGLEFRRSCPMYVTVSAAA